jgi:hypothetical protein
MLSGYLTQFERHYIMTTATKAKPAALFAGKGMAARQTALMSIAALSYSEESTRAAALVAARKVLGNAPTEAQLAATRLEYTVGRVAARLPVSELPRGKTSEGERLDHARALVTQYAAPVKPGAKAYKLRKGMLGYRTELQHRIIRAAQEAASQFLADAGVGKAQTSKARNAAKATRAPSMAGSGKGKTAKPAAPSHTELVKPAAPVTADDVLAFFGQQSRMLSDYANRHAKVTPTDAGEAVAAFRKAIVAAANALQERKAIAAAAKGEGDNVKPITAAKPAHAKA